MSSCKWLCVCITRCRLVGRYGIMYSVTVYYSLSSFCLSAGVAWVRLVLPLSAVRPQGHWRGVCSEDHQQGQVCEGCRWGSGGQCCCRVVFFSVDTNGWCCFYLNCTRRITSVVIILLLHINLLSIFFASISFRFYFVTGITLTSLNWETWVSSHFCFLTTKLAMIIMWPVMWSRVFLSTCARCMTMARMCTWWWSWWKVESSWTRSSSRSSSPRERLLPWCWCWWALRVMMQDVTICRALSWYGSLFWEGNGWRIMRGTVSALVCVKIRINKCVICFYASQCN